MEKKQPLYVLYNILQRKGLIEDKKFSSSLTPIENFFLQLKKIFKKKGCVFRTYP